MSSVQVPLVHEMIIDRHPGADKPSPRMLIEEGPHPL